MSHPFDRLTIHALRSVRELELSGLGQVNLLVGENDSGKTTVLEALKLYCDPLNPLHWASTVYRRESAGSVVNAVEQFRWLFPQHGAGARSDEPYRGEVHLSAEGRFEVKSISAQYQDSRGIARPSRGDLSSAAQFQMQLDMHGAEIRLEATTMEGESELRRFTLWEESGFKGAEFMGGPNLEVAMLNPHDHRAATFIAIKAFSEARLSGYQESVLQLLHALDPRITGLEILAPRGQPMLYLQDSSAGLAPLSTFGDGIRRALLFAVMLPQVAGGVFLIDELETAIHVSVLGKVFRWMLDACKQYRVQLFATTHSLETVDAILAVDTSPEENIVGYRLERSDNRTQVKRFGESMLKRLRQERGLDVR